MILDRFDINKRVICWCNKIDKTNGKESFYLMFNSRIITPFVTRIQFERKMEVFLICDEITTWFGIKGHLYFYVDDYGAPVSNVFNDLSDVVFPIEKTLSYLEKYDEIKLNIEEELADILAQNFFLKKEEITKEVTNELGL